MSPLLESRALTAGYDDQIVLRDVDLTVEEGQILAVLGPNGAGKTTLLLTLAGLLPAISGSAWFEGHVIHANRPHRLARQGLALVPDDRSLFATLSVRENLEIACRKSGGSIGEILDLFPSLAPRMDVRAGSLSGGEQQMLVLGRALIQKPRVLLLDEMSMGLAPLVIESLLPILTGFVREAGNAIVLVEQHVTLALEVATHAMVLVHGDVSMQGSASDIAADRGAVEAAYLGRSAATSAAATQRSI